MMFPTWHIMLTAVVTALLAGGGSWFFSKPSRSVTDALLVGSTAAIGVLLWRLGSNTPILNADPLPGISPADVLSAPLAYVAVGIGAEIRGNGASQRLELAQALAALIALIVNIVTI